MVSQHAGRAGLTTTQWATLLARCGSSLSQSYLLSLDLKFRWILKKSKDSGDQNSGDQNLRILVIKLLNVGDPPGGQDWPSVSGPWFACSLHSSPLPNDWGRLCSLRWEPQQEGEDLHGICLASKGRRPGVAGKEHGWKCEIMLFLLRQQLVRSSLTTRESSTSRSGNPWDARYSPLRFGKWSYDNFSTTFKFDLKLPISSTIYVSQPTLGSHFQVKPNQHPHQVLSILITAPLGAISIVFLGPRLLEKQEQNPHLQQQDPHLQEQEPKPPTFEEAVGGVNLQLTKETKELP